MPSGIDRATMLSGARHLIAQGLFEEAFLECESGLRLIPSDPELHYLAGTTAWWANRTTQSGVHLESAARLAPQHPAAQQALADWYLNTGNVAMALAFSERAMAIAPSEPEVLTTRASVLAMSGDARQAWELLLKVFGGRYTPPRAVALRA